MIKVIILIKCQVKILVKMDKCPSKWPWFIQIGHIEGIGLNQIDHLDLILNQIYHYDLTHNQIKHTHLGI